MSALSRSRAMRRRSLGSWPIIWSRSLSPFLVRAFGMVFLLYLNTVFVGVNFILPLPADCPVNVGRGDCRSLLYDRVGKNGHLLTMKEIKDAVLDAAVLGPQLMDA